MSSITTDLSEIKWQAVSAIAVSVSAFINLILVLGLIFAYRNFKESRLNRNGAMFTLAIKKMKKTSQLINLIQHSGDYGSIIDIGQPWFKSPWNKKTEKAANELSIILQQLSYLANNGLISKKHLQNMWGPTFVISWELLANWVKNKRNLNKEPIEVKDGAFSRVDFEIFSIECKKRITKRSNGPKKFRIFCGASL